MCPISGLCTAVEASLLFNLLKVCKLKHNDGKCTISGFCKCTALEASLFCNCAKLCKLEI